MNHKNERNGVPAGNTWRKGIDRERKVLSHASQRSRVSFSARLCFLFFGKGVYLLSSVPWAGSLLQLGHTVMHACTRTHKHSEIWTLVLPRYIIIPANCTEALVEGQTGSPRQADSLQRSAEGDVVTNTCSCFMSEFLFKHFGSSSSAVLRQSVKKLNSQFPQEPDEF